MDLYVQTPCAKYQTTAHIDKLMADFHHQKFAHNLLFQSTACGGAQLLICDTSYLLDKDIRRYQCTFTLIRSA